MALSLKLTRALALAAVLVVAGPASAEVGKPSRKLVLAGSKQLKPVLEALCRKAEGDGLRSLYTGAVLVGSSSDLGGLRRAAPGADADAAGDFLRVLRAIDRDFVSCGAGGERKRGRVDPPADLLFMEINFTPSERVNVELKQLRSDDGTLAGSGVVATHFGQGLDLTSAADVEGFAGCVGWAFWRVTSWLEPGTSCRRWGLPEEPHPARSIGASAASSLVGQKPQGGVTPVLRHPVAPLIAVGTGVALGVAGFVLRQNGASQIEQIERSDVFDGDKSSHARSLDATGIGLMVAGGVAIAAGVVLYLRDRSALPERQLAWRF